jgi:mannose-6-phosphate isomerase-like protein (cupin superfamily)
MTTTEQAKAARPTIFSVDGEQLLSAGNTQRLLAMAPSLWAHVKVYAEGGENGIHAHPNEDHMFFVLAGEATFLAPDERETVVGPYQGIMMPRGAAYAFRSSGSHNLVMLRVGAPTDTAMIAADPREILPGQGIPVPAAERIHVDGTPAPGLDPTNKTGAVPGVPVPGSTLEVPAPR